MTSSRAPSTEWRLRVLRNGYLPIPVASPDPQDGQSGKKPALKEWSKIHRLEEEDIKGWEQRFPKAQNTGVICGNVVGLDIDVDDSDIVEKIKAAAFRMLGARAPVRIGRAPRALIVYRTKTPFKKLTSREFVLPNGCIAKVEVLGKGQQFVADGIHPMTKLPYTWIGRSLEEVAFDKLPEIDEKAVQEFLRLVDDIMLENGSQERKTILKYESEGKETAELDNAPIDRRTILEALSFVPNDDAAYDFWLRIGFALHSELGKEGFELWDDWSRKASKYDQTFTRKTWDYFKKGGGVTIGTLFYVAVQNGWRQQKGADVRPAIIVNSGELHETVDQAERALIASGIELYQRGGVLVRLIHGGENLDLAATSDAVKLMPVSEEWLHETFMRVATFHKVHHEHGGVTKINCPKSIAKTYLARTGQWNLPTLKAVVHSPTIRADGSIIERPGYDTETQLYAKFNPADFPSVAPNPSRADAIASLKVLKKAVATFPFETEADCSVAIAAILTGCCRPLLLTAPMFGYSAPVAGSGKSLLVDLTSIIVHGRPAAVLAPGRTEEELEKRLGAAFINGASALSLDNCTEPLNGAFLCQVLTQPLIQTRILGQSKNVEVPTNCLMLANGNNLTFADDMTRRVLLCTLNPKVERPEEREFETDIYKETFRSRPALVSAVLTIMRAYIIAGLPQCTGVLGSFPEWSKLIRSSLVWLGEVDPCDTMKRVRDNDLSLAKNLALLHQIDHHFGNSRFTVAELMGIAQQRQNHVGGGYNYLNEELHQTLADFSGGKDALNSISIGKALGRLVGRICDGMTLVKFNGSGGRRHWQLEGGACKGFQNIL
jgi:hypothetical protein